MIYRRRHETAFSQDERKRRLGEVLSGTVVYVPDGDGLTVHTTVECVTVRLWGIDAPEIMQRYGEASCAYLYGLCNGQEVRLIVRGRDRYKRTIGDVYLADGSRLAEVMIRAGCAWWYREYAPHESKLKELEKVARAEHVGLWRERNPTPPWEFRNQVDIVPMSPAALVWLTGRNRRYHRQGCSKLRGSRKAMAKGRAMAIGCRPCTFCRP